jgi:REP element-mobilizing transposase RayT
MATTYSNLLFHLVFSTKHRAPLIGPEWQDDLYGYIGGIVRQRRGKLLVAGGMPDHIHLLVKTPTDLAVADLVRDVKAISSGWRHEGGNTEFAWQTGYAAFTLGEEVVPTVENYIRTQHEHHRTESFEDEFVGLLTRHGIDYNPKYLWD